MFSSNHNLGIADTADECALPPSLPLSLPPPPISAALHSLGPVSQRPSAPRFAVRMDFRPACWWRRAPAAASGGAWLTPRTAAAAAAAAAAVCESAATIGRPFKAAGRPTDSGQRLRESEGTCGENHPREMTAAEACVSAAPLASVRGPSVRPPVSPSR